MSNTLSIDGSYGEGGGQILRSSMALSCITGRPIRITSIRAGRRKPGLQPQHLTSAKAAATISGGSLSGASVGSMTLEFTPGQVKPGSYTFDVSEVKASAGSVGLIFQTIFLPLLLADGESRVTLKGGTHNPWAPTFNYISDVFLAAMERMGARCWVRMEKAGYYPIGGGEVRVQIEPLQSLSPLDIAERGELESVFCTSGVSNLTMDIARRQLDRGLARIHGMGVAGDGETVEYRSPGKGTTFFILAQYANTVAGFSSLGELGKRAEKVADEACEEFQRYHASGQAVEPHLADQLVLPLALATDSSRFTASRITRHLLTNIWVAQQFLPVRFEVDGEEGQAGMITVCPR
jgi:RNA 3'-terminal phosphate cyclase (ATP)